VTRRDHFDPTGALSELARTVTPHTEIADVLNDVVALAKRQLPGVDEASITLIRSRKAFTAATTGELASALDEMQYEEGYGPCLDSGRSDEMKHIDDFATETRWPRYVLRARELGVGSSLSLPLPVDHYLVGALNMYCRKPHGFSEDDVALAQALTSHLTTVLSHAETTSVHRSRAENLEHALLTRSVIDQAKGIIMAQHKCNAEAAFGMLREMSMKHNLKLYELAAQLVASASNHPVPPVPARPGA
jgi:GAF domain-containing protein